MRDVQRGKSGSAYASVHHVIAADPEREVRTDERRAEQVDDDLRAPVGHLAPGKQVAKNARPSA